MCTGWRCPQASPFTCPFNLPIQVAHSVGHSSWPFKWAIQVGHSSGPFSWPFSWPFSLGHSSGPFKWAIQVGHSVGHSAGHSVWAIQMGHSSGPFSWPFNLPIQIGYSVWAIQVGHASGPFSLPFNLAIRIGYSVGPFKWAIQFGPNAYVCHQKGSPECTASLPDWPFSKVALRSRNRLKLSHFPARFCAQHSSRGLVAPTKSSSTPMDGAGSQAVVMFSAGCDAAGLKIVLHGLWRCSLQAVMPPVSELCRAGCVDVLRRL